MDPHFYVVHVKLCLIVAVSDLATFCGELVRQFLMLSCLVCSSDVGGVSLHASSSSRVHICIGHTVMGLCGHTPLAYRQSSSGRLLSPLGSACLLCSLLFALGCSLQTSSLNEWTGLKWPLCSTWALKGLYVTCLIRPFAQAFCLTFMHIGHVQYTREQRGLGIFGVQTRAAVNRRPAQLPWAVALVSVDVWATGTTQVWLTELPN